MTLNGATCPERTYDAAELAAAAELVAGFVAALVAGLVAGLAPELVAGQGQQQPLILTIATVWRDWLRD